jgi:hypothetical protein
MYTNLLSCRQQLWLVQLARFLERLCEPIRAARSASWHAMNVMCPPCVTPCAPKWTTGSPNCHPPALETPLFCGKPSVRGVTLALATVHKNRVRARGHMPPCDTHGQISPPARKLIHPTTRLVSAATRRQSIARGVSPWMICELSPEAPTGRKYYRPVGAS